MQSPGVPLKAMAKLIGPPPKARAAAKYPTAPTLPLRPCQEDDPADLGGDPSPAAADPYAIALLEQSKALRALVSQLQSTASDPMSELATNGASSSLSMKGLSNREKLQRELALREGRHFLKISQTIAKRMSPSGAIPTSLDETSEVSLLAYLERFGGYGQNRELGLVQWAVGHIFDALAQNDLNAARDHTALLATMIEQANLDGGHWQIAWLLGLLEDPPQNLWLTRSSAATGSRRPFGPMVPQAWATTALAVIKEQEILTTKRSEATSSKATTPSPSTDGPKWPPRQKAKKGQKSGAPISEQ